MLGVCLSIAAATADIAVGSGNFDAAAPSRARVVQMGEAAALTELSQR